MLLMDPLLPKHYVMTFSQIARCRCGIYRVRAVNMRDDEARALNRLADRILRVRVW